MQGSAWAEDPPGDGGGDIAAIVARMAEAWNRGDARSFAARFASDGSFTSILGTLTYGREAFEAGHARLFETVFKGSAVSFTITKLRFVREDVAIAEVDSELKGYTELPAGVRATADGILRTGLQLVFSRDPQGWWIVAFHEVAVAPAEAPAIATAPAAPASPAQPRSSKYGLAPVHYAEAVQRYFKDHLTDPDSVVYREITTPQQGYVTGITNTLLISETRTYGWIVKATINAKDSHGRYVGFRGYTFLFRGEKIATTRLPLPAGEIH
jgi:uncharacterized protein (TIGR02246 family)